jgi:hypothetical protein
VDEVASVRELEILSVAAWASGREISVGGKHRTEVTEATEGIWGGWPKIYRWQRGRLGGEIRCNRKASHRGHRGHRGDLGWVAKSIGGIVGVWARNQVQQKSIAQRSQRPQRGIWGGWPKSIGGSVGVWAGKSGATEKHRTEVTEGGLGWVAKILSATAWAPGEKSSPRGKHRTEVVEGDWVGRSKILSATAWASG